MDRRQVLGAAAVALGGTLVGLPAEAASFDEWVILEDQHDFNHDGQPDLLTYGSILKATKGGGHKVKLKKNKLIGADGSVSISVTESTRGTYTGELLKQVPPLPNPQDPKGPPLDFAHDAKAVPVIKYKALSIEARKTVIALNAVQTIIAAYIAPNLDALDQIDEARKQITALERTVHNSDNLSTKVKSEIQGYIQKSRGFLGQAQTAIEKGGNSPSPLQIAIVIDRVLTAAGALQVIFATLQPAA